MFDTKVQSGSQATHVFVTVNGLTRLTKPNNYNCEKKLVHCNSENC